MKYAIACALLVLFATTASAADKVSKSALSSMGLAGMQEMSDSDGMAVRGKGTFAGVWGGSRAQWYGGQESINNYESGANWIGKSSGAVGGSFSFAGKVALQAAGDPTGTAWTLSASGGFAGGVAGAYAW
jgi:hypothetical protein